MILTFTSSVNRSRTLVFYRVWTDLSFLSGKRTSIRAYPLDPRERYICDFFLYHIKIEGECGWIIWGPKGMLPPLSNYWVLGACPPPPFFLRLCIHVRCGRKIIHRFHVIYMCNFMQLSVILMTLTGIIRHVLHLNHIIKIYLKTINRLVL